MIVMNAAIRILSGIILRIAEANVWSEQNDGSRRAHADRILRSGGASVGQKTDRLPETGLSVACPISAVRKFHLAFPP